MANIFYYEKIILKIVDFYVDNNIFWTTQNEPDCTILIKKKTLA